MSRGWSAAGAAVLLMTFVLLGGGLSAIESQAPASGLGTADLSTLDEATFSPDSGIEAGGGAPTGSGANVGVGGSTAISGGSQIEATVTGELSKIDATGMERAALLFGYAANKLGLLNADINLNINGESSGNAEMEPTDAQGSTASGDRQLDGESGTGVDFDLGGGVGEAPSDTASDDSITGDNPTSGTESVLSKTLDSVTLPMLAGVIAIMMIGYLYVSKRNPIAAIVALPAVIGSWIVTALYRLATAFERVVTDLYSVLSVADLWSVIVEWVTDLRKSTSLVISGSTSEPDTTAPSNTEQDRNHDEVLAREQIRAAWARLVSMVGIRQYHRRTPAEVRQRALAEGQPSDSVAKLTRAFRAVEYGEEDASKYLNSAEEAAAQLEESSEGTKDTERTKDNSGSTTLRNRLFGRGGDN